MIKDCKKETPIVAICYDFDKTLSPYDMQAQGFIQAIDCEVDKFWQEADKLAQDNQMDGNLAYMYLMSKKSKGKLAFTKHTLMQEGSKVKLFNGVNGWFDRINAYAKEKGILVEHYVISSGLKEMIEGVNISKNFKEIYASSFYYNQEGYAEWPAQVVNYTNKTQFIFRISKGVLEVNDQRVNDYFKEQKFRVPFTNMLYIGDSDTDIPCMKLINANGGYSIGVYNSETNDKTKVYKMLEDNRIKYFVPADYSENSQMDILVKNIIDKIIAEEKLKNTYNACLSEKNK